MTGSLLDGIAPTGANFERRNASVWREDLMRVYGFGERLENAGIRGRYYRHRALVGHLDRHLRCT